MLALRRRFGGLVKEKLASGFERTKGFISDHKKELAIAGAGALAGGLITSMITKDDFDRINEGETIKEVEKKENGEDVKIVYKKTNDGVYAIVYKNGKLYALYKYNQGFGWRRLEFSEPIESYYTPSTNNNNNNLFYMAIFIVILLIIGIFYTKIIKETEREHNRL